MCGIIGIVSKKRAVSEAIVEALKRLEYRGYDSTGIATVANGAIQRRRSAGKLADLERLLQAQPLSGQTGIGYTRWATHGVPNEANANPHATPEVAVVHNGIIENYQTTREELTAKGHVFTSQTDTEVI